MSKNVSSDDIARLFAEGLAQIEIAMKPLTEAVESYRAQCERNGYSDAVSRGMAADYHVALLRMVMR